jgi:hypothetical protein
MPTHAIPFREKKAVIEPTGRLWPNGEFTIGYAVGGGLEKETEFDDFIKGTLSHVGLSLPPNSHSERDEGAVRRGVKGLTSHGKKVLRNSVWRIQRIHGRGRMAFVTLTLPGVSFEQGWNISTDWARIVRVFFQRLGRYFEKIGLPTQYAACTEMQPGRVGSEGHPSLHLHFVCVTKRRGERGYAITPGEFRWLWASVVGPMCPDIEFWGGVENCVAMKKDASAYMAKYLSKGSADMEPPRSDETGWSLPTSWYSVRLPLRQWVLENVRRHPKLIEHIERLCRDGTIHQFCFYCHEGILEEAAGPGPHYYVGKLKGEDMQELLEVWRAEVL